MQLRTACTRIWEGAMQMVRIGALLRAGRIARIGQDEITAQLRQTSSRRPAASDPLARTGKSPARPQSSK